MFKKLIEAARDYWQNSFVKKEIESQLEENGSHAQIEATTIILEKNTIYSYASHAINEREQNDILHYALSVHTFDIKFLLNDKVYTFFLNPNYKTYGEEIGFSINSTSEPSDIIEFRSENFEKFDSMKEKFSKNVLPITLERDTLEGIAQNAWEQFESIHMPSFKTKGLNLECENRFKKELKQTIVENPIFETALNEIITLMSKNQLEAQTPLGHEVRNKQSKI